MLDLKSPWLNAAGSLGYAPDAHGPIPLSDLGAFVTNPISLRPRRVAAGTRLFEHAGGVLLHTGMPNPGLANSIRRYAAKWARAGMPIIPHLIAEQADEVRKLVPRFEELDNILAIELGLDRRVGQTLAIDLVKAAMGELPLIARVPLERTMQLAEGLMQTGAVAISLGPPSGALMSGTTASLHHGRLYGSAIYPQALAVVEGLAAAGIPVIGAGGVADRAQGVAMLAAGAFAVQLDIALWKGDWEWENGD